LCAFVVVCVCGLIVVQTLVVNCEQYVSEHRDYDAKCQFARDWLVAARRQLDSSVSVVGDEQRLEAAKAALTVSDWSLFLTGDCQRFVEVVL